MKKCLAMILAAAMVLSLAACAPKATPSASPSTPAETVQPSATPEPSAEPAAIADGTYEGKSHGFGGELTVNVTVTDSKITAVDVTAQTESAGVSDDILAAMPQRIVDEQSYAVDAISGATYTANAIKNAVKSALKAAGAQDGQFDSVPVYTQKEETLDADVVVLGSGLAGITAAMEAKTAGANVIILEKLGRIGGSSVTSGGIVYATGSPINSEYDNDPADMAAYFQQRANGLADQALIDFGAQHSGESVKWLMDNGVAFMENGIPTGLSPAPRGTFALEGAAGLIRPLKEKLVTLGIPVYLETPATALSAAEGGAGYVVKAQSKDTAYTINAKAVVMATGGFDASDELRAKYSPDAANASFMSSVGNTGDGIAMGEAVGAATLFRGGVMGFRAVNPALPMMAGVNGLVWAGTLGVTDEGVRFVDESVDYPVYFTKMVETGRDEFYYIFDSASAELCEVAVSQGMGFKADTIEDLATAAGMDAAALKATFDRYQELAAAGKDEDFGKANIAPLAAEGPYYAIRFKKATIASFGGLMINTSSEVLDADGNAIPGFYAAGECANGQFFDKEYPASGTMLSLSTTFGRMAGTNAANFAAGK